MNDFLDINIFNNWNELLKENNYNKKGRPFKIPGIIILYLAKLRELRGISFRQLETELHNLSKYLNSRKYHLHQYIEELENNS